MKLFPALPVPNFVLFPGCTVSLQFGFPALQEQLELAARTEGLIVVAHSIKSSQGWVPSQVGCLTQVREIKQTGHGLQATLAGRERVVIESHTFEEERLLWCCRPVPKMPWVGKKYPELSGMPDVVKSCRTKLPAELWLDVAAFHMSHLPLEQKLALLAEPDPKKRYYQLIESTREQRKKRKLYTN